MCKKATWASWSGWSSSASLLSDSLNSINSTNSTTRFLTHLAGNIVVINYSRDNAACLCVHIEDKIMTFKVMQSCWFWHQSKARIGDFVLILNSNLGLILPRFRLYSFWTPKSTISIPLSYSGQKFRVSFGVDPWCWGLQRANTSGYLTVKLFSKNSHLCDHNPPALQTDGRTT